METGVISHDNLASILRNISQRRRQGILEVGSKNASVQIFFAQGKVLDARRTDKPIAKDLIERLLLSQRILVADSLDETSYEALQKSLVAAGEHDVADKEFIVWANQERVLDVLYSLDTESSNYYTFKAQMVEIEKDFSASISVGQVLLDLVALQSDQPEYQALFPDGVTIIPIQDAANCSVEEKAVLHVLNEPTEVSELSRKCLLSSYHFQSAMLTLVQRGAIQKQKEVPVNGVPKSTPENENLLQAFEDSIDIAFEAEQAVAEAAEKIITGTQAKPRTSSTRAEPKIEKQSWIARANTQLLNSVWVPRILGWFLLLSAAISPFISWQRMWGWF